MSDSRFFRMKTMATSFALIFKKIRSLFVHYAVDAVSFSLILFLSISTAVKISGVLDLSNMNIDDLFYLTPNNSLEWGLSYRLWNKIIANVFSVEHYHWNVIHTNQIISVIFIPALLYVVARLYNVSPFWTTIFCLFVLSGNVLYMSPGIPLISAFATAVDLVGILIALTVPFSRWTSFAFVSLTISTARPEFFLSSIIFLAASTLVLLQNLTDRRIDVPNGLATIVVFAFFIPINIWHANENTT